MSHHSFRANARVSIDGHAYTLTGPNAAGTFCAIAGDGATLELNQVKLMERYREGTLGFIDASGKPPRVRSVSTIADLPEKQRNSARRRKQYLDRLEAAGCMSFTPSPTLRFFTRMVATEMGDKSPPSAISIYRWHRRRLRGRHGAVALANRVAAQGGKGKSRLPEQVVNVIEEVIDDLYLGSREPGPDAHREVKRRLTVLNNDQPAADQLPMLSQSTFYRFLKKRDAFEVAVARYGEREARMRFRSSGNSPAVTRILERVEIDHTPLDLFVVHSKSFLPMGRPWLTLLVDKFSRMILGYHLSFSHPGTDSVMRALRHAILPKGDVCGRYPRLKHDWVAHGIPEILVCDNGLEFHSQALEDAAFDLDFALDFCPVRLPYRKGTVERLLKTQNYTLMHTLPGTSFAKFWQRYDYDPLKHAVVTLEALQEIMHIWILDYYSVKLHRGLGTAPMVKWEEGSVRNPPQLPERADLIGAYLGVPAERKIWHYGIQLHSDQRYNSEPLQQLRQRYGEALKVGIKVDPDDLTFIHVRDPESKEYFPVPNTNPDAVRGLTLDQLKLIQRHQRQVREDEDREISLAEARAEMRAVVAELFQSRKLSDRKRAAKHAGLDADPADAPTTSPLAATTETAEASVPPYMQPEQAEQPKLRSWVR